MIRLTIILFAFLSLSAFGQRMDPADLAKPIVEEGKLLYKSELASWYGTDLFLEKHPQRENIGGYFSYSENDVAKCIFFSKSNTPKVIGTVSFDPTYNLQKAKTDLTEREFSKTERDLFLIRKIALEKIRSETTLFKTYKNTTFNLIPLIKGKEKKVYVLTGPQQSGVVIFGNDYLLTFDQNNNLISIKQLHKNIIPITIGSQESEGKKVEGTMHSHSPETGDFITATDICTLMLYSKLAKWKVHNVTSKQFLNIWNCETNELTIIPMEAVKRKNEIESK